MTSELFRQLRGAHAAYEKDLAEAEAQHVKESQSASQGSSHKKTDEQLEKSRKRQAELDVKQKHAEANEHLQNAMTSMIMKLKQVDVLPENVPSFNSS